MPKQGRSLIRIFQRQRFSIEEAAEVIIWRSLGKSRKNLCDPRELVFGLIQHTAEEDVRLLDGRIETNGSKERLNCFGKTSEAVVGYARGQLQLGALVEILPACDQSFERRSESLLFQLHLG